MMKVVPEKAATRAYRHRPSAKVEPLAYCSQPALQPPKTKRRLSLSVSGMLLHVGRRRAACCKASYSAVLSSSSCVMAGCCVCALITVILTAGAVGSFAGGL